MKSDQFIHFKLWRISSEDKAANSLFLRLTFIFKCLENYFSLKSQFTNIIIKKMSFFDAIIALEKNHGLSSMPLKDNNSLYQSIPLIARHKKKDMPVVMLPLGPWHYQVISQEAQEIIAIKKIPERFDELILVFAAKDLSKKTHHGHNAYISSLLPLSALFLSALAVVLLGQWLIWSLFNYKEYQLNYYVLSALFMVFSLPLLHNKWLAKKNYSVGRLWLMQNFYRRIFADAQAMSQQGPMLFAHRLLKKAVHRYFFVRPQLAIAWVTVIFIVLASFIIYPLAGLILLMACIALGFIGKIIHYQMKQNKDLRNFYQEQLRSSLEQYESALPLAIGLHATSSFIMHINSWQERLLKERFKKSFWMECRLIIAALWLIITIIILAFIYSHHSLELSIYQVSFFIVETVIFSVASVYLLYHHTDIVYSDSLSPSLLSEASHVQPVNILGTIEFIQVSFAYEESSRVVIKNCDVSFDAKKFHVIAGASSVGKTTLLKLAMGLLMPTKGYVAFDGQDGLSLQKPLLHRHFGVTLADDQLFAGSIAHNILCGRLIKGSVLTKLLISHEIFDCLLDLPMGLETYVISRGKNIAQLERTAIFLARALVHEPKVLFMDELLNGLSPAQQTVIVDFLSSLSINRVLVADSKIAEQAADKIINL